MKLLISICVLTLVLLNPTIGFSQKKLENSGEKYVLHTVSKSETVFSICQKYQITQKEIQQANPGLTAVLQAGTVVKIPERNSPANNIQIEKKTAENVQAEKVVEQKEKSTTVDHAAQSEFYYHKVLDKQTIYSISRQYGVSGDELFKYNPDLENGLKVGQVLKIPVNQKKNQEPELSESVVKYQVEKGETLFSLAARFGVEVGDIKRLNPSLLSRSLEAGEAIIIPQKSAEVAVPEKETPVADSPENSGSRKAANCLPSSGKVNQKFKAGLLLPFHLSGNDRVDLSNLNKTQLLSKISPTAQSNSIVDTTIVQTGMNVDPKIEGFLEFYEGTLLAVDSLQRKGMNVELQVFDASSPAMVKALIQLDEFRDLNLIIGPIYPDLQEIVAPFAEKNRIPMVSPLSSAGSIEDKNSYYFKVNPSKEFLIEQSANYVEKQFSSKNFILLQSDDNSNSPEEKLAELSKQKLNGKSGDLFHEYDFKKQGVNTLKPLLNETGENVFVIQSDNEAKVSVAVTNLTGLAEHYDVILMGTSTLTKLKSIPTESYHRIRLRYLSPYFIDYNKPLVRRFVGQYREIFTTEPTQYSFQGFDVSYYFLSALFVYGSDFRSCISKYPMELTQTYFDFKKTASGTSGFMNHGLFVTAYERNYDVLNLGTVGGDK